MDAEEMCIDVEGTVRKEEEEEEKEKKKEKKKKEKEKKEKKEKEKKEKKTSRSRYDIHLRMAVFRRNTTKSLHPARET
ncbi:Hypothetical predicted protein [Octopus vulgaris]|uniref:Uncharacterized protein n=1 Tax=Octopus vulgaris TaxID=6645 RepID=A0AA36EWP8_OCTVU|nr:Hypothetical predicted protein [Octopus vulgaris]